MRARPRLLRLVAVVALVTAAVVAVGTGPAVAQATCGFDEPTGVVTITLAANLPATVVRSGDTITLDGQACGTATVANTDQILVSGAGAGAEEDFTIDLSGGAFAPGKTAETDPDGEIEFQVTLGDAATLLIAGGTGNDAITAGVAGVNTNAAEATDDPDVTITGSPTVSLSGRDGADTLSIAGGDGTGEGVTEAVVDGGAGDDTLIGRLGGSTLTGGDGVDTLDYSGADTITANLSTGVVQPGVGLVDFVGSSENVIGTSGDDAITGDGAANSLLGGDGDDVLDGGKGDDELDGGNGTDTASFTSSRKAVTVDLRSGSAEGHGADTLTGIENVEGSRRGDELTGDGVANRLNGGDGDDQIQGRGKGDLVLGGRGDDILSGNDGRDTLDGAAGRDQLDGGKAKDTCIPGKDADAWTNCETVKL